MKYRARFTNGGRERFREVRVEDGGSTKLAPLASGAGAVTFTLDGVAGEASVERPAPGVFSLVLPDGRHAEAVVHQDGDGSLRVRVGSSTFQFELLDELAALAMAAAGPRRGRKLGDVKAQIPGRVVRLLVAAGDEVEAGRPLLVLEAMKMENEVRAGRDGRIKSVEVLAGQAVMAGDVLVRFDD